MKSVVLDIPEDSLLALTAAPEHLGEEIRMAAAVKLFEMGRLSSGAAAHLAGVPKCVFMTRLADYGVATFQQTKADLQEEKALA